MQQVWTSDSEGSLGGVPIRSVSSDFHAHKTTRDQIVVLKPGSMIQEYGALAGDPKRIVEVGIFEGGSALLLADMFPEARILGIDHARGNPAIGYHAHRLGFAERIKLHFGVSQDDADRIPDLLRTMFGGDSPDFILDDASHIYGYSTRCFDILFPRLAVGGLYVIEDWGWHYWPGYEPHPAFMQEGIPLSDMVHELVAATAMYRTITIEKMHGSLIAIRKLGDLPPFAEIRRAMRQKYPVRTSAAR